MSLCKAIFCLIAVRIQCFQRRVSLPFCEGNRSLSFVILLYFGMQHFLSTVNGKRKCQELYEVQFCCCIVTVSLKKRREPLVQHFVVFPQFPGCVPGMGSSVLVVKMSGGSALLVLPARARSLPEWPVCVAQVKRLSPVCCFGVCYPLSPFLKCVLEDSIVCASPEPHQ